MSTTTAPSTRSRSAATLSVHRLGFGAMRITGEGIWGPPRDHDAALAVLRALPALGIDFIDTADAYGPEVSEDLIREALHPYDRRPRRDEGRAHRARARRHGPRSGGPSTSASAAR